MVAEWDKIQDGAFQKGMKEAIEDIVRKSVQYKELYSVIQQCLYKRGVVVALNDHGLWHYVQYKSGKKPPKHKFSTASEALIYAFELLDNDIEVQE